MFILYFQGHLSTRARTQFAQTICCPWSVVGNWFTSKFIHSLNPWIHWELTSWNLHLLWHWIASCISSHRISFKHNCQLFWLYKQKTQVWLLLSNKDYCKNNHTPQKQMTMRFQCPGKTTIFILILILIAIRVIVLLRVAFILLPI